MFVRDGEPVGCCSGHVLSEGADISRWNEGDQRIALIINLLLLSGARPASIRSLNIGNCAVCFQETPIAGVEEPALLPSVFIEFPDVKMKKGVQ
jgi:hypothetical protein